MKRESIVQGLAKWAGREITPRLPQFSPQRLGMATLETLAMRNPQAAEILAAAFLGPIVPTLVSAAGQQFDAVSDALLDAIKREGKILLTLPAGPFGLGEPHPYSLSESDFRNIVNEIRSQEASQ